MAPGSTRSPLRTVVIGVIFVMAALMWPWRSGDAQTFRVGNHADYGRIVIEHPDLDQPAINRQGRTAIIDMGAPVAFALPERLRAIEPWVTGVRRLDGQRIEIRLEPDVGLSQKRWRKDLFVVDLETRKAPPNEGSAGTAAADISSGPAAANVSAGTVAADISAASDGPDGNVSVGLDEEIDVEREREPQQGAAAAAPVDKMPSTVLVEERSGQAAGLRANDAGIAIDRNGRDPVAEIQPAHDTDLEKLEIAVLGDPEFPSLHFKIQPDRPVAVFRRGRVLWVVLSRRSGEILWDDPDEILADAVSSIKEVRHADATILRMGLWTNMGLAAVREADGWRVEFGGDTAAAGRRPAVREDGSLSMPGIGQFITVADPLVGDLLDIGLSSLDDDGADPLRLVQAEVLPSVQGIVLRLLSNSLRPKVIEDAGRLEGLDHVGHRGGDRGFGKPKRLEKAGHDEVDADHDARDAGHLASDEDISRDRGEFDDGQRLEGLDDMATSSTTVVGTHSGGPGEARSDTDAAGHEVTDRQFVEASNDDQAVSDVERAVSDRSSNVVDNHGEILGIADWWEEYGDEKLPGPQNLPESSAEALFNARYFIARSFGAEALSHLDAYRDKVPDSKDDDRYHLVEASLRGAANYLMHRLTRARVEFDKLAEIKSSELDVWLTALSLSDKAAEPDRDLLLASRRILSGYPPRLRFMLGLAVAEKAVEVGLVNPALAILDDFRDMDLNETERWDHEFLHARLLEADGDVSRALGQLEKLADKAPDFSREVEARFQLTALTEKNGGLGLDQAIRELEDQRIFWRGHPLESRMIKKIADLKLENGDLLAGIDLFEEAIANDVDARWTHEIEQARDTLVLDVLAEARFSSQPLLGLMLYNRYPQLLENNPDRDQLVRDLAVRLANAGFADVSAEILDAKRGFVLGGGDREVRLSVAEKQLEFGNPEGVFSTLPFDGSGRDIEAQARIELKEIEKARALLDPESNVQDLVDTIDTYWREKDFSALVDFDRILVQRSDLQLLDKTDLQNAVLKIASAQLIRGQHYDLERFLKAIEGHEDTNVAGLWRDIMTRPDLTGDVNGDFIGKMDGLMQSYRQSVDELANL